MVKHSKPYSVLLVTSYCALHQQKGGQGEVGEITCSDMHMVAARRGCKMAMGGTRWVNSCPGCMERLRKHYSHLVGGQLISGREDCLGSDWVFDNQEC